MGFDEEILSRLDRIELEYNSAEASERLLSLTEFDRKYARMMTQNRLISNEVKVLKAEVMLLQSQAKQRSRQLNLMAITFCAASFLSISIWGLYSRLDTGKAESPRSLAQEAIAEYP